MFILLSLFVITRGCCMTEKPAGGKCIMYLDGACVFHNQLLFITCLSFDR